MWSRLSPHNRSSVLDTLNSHRQAQLSTPAYGDDEVTEKLLLVGWNFSSTSCKLALQPGMKRRLEQNLSGNKQNLKKNRRHSRQEKLNRTPSPDDSAEENSEIALEEEMEEQKKEEEVMDYKEPTMYDSLLESLRTKQEEYNTDSEKSGDDVEQAHGASDDDNEGSDSENSSLSEPGASLHGGVLGNPVERIGGTETDDDDSEASNSDGEQGLGVNGQPTRGACASMREVASVKKAFTPPREVHVQVTHSMPPEKIEIFDSLREWAAQNLLVNLKPVEKCWQPTDFLPDPASEGFDEQVKELRERSKEIPDDYFVVLIGDMITEEALPTYQTMINTLDGVRDETGASPSPWAVWTRAWTAEENRHGDLLNKYLYLSGRVDMKQIEKTIQYLIGSGMDPRTENNPYLGFVYTSFQERATFVSHGNTARLAKEHGDMKLAQICGSIAADEKRHETAYTKIVEKLLEVDPDGAVLAIGDMMKKKISMPAHLMYDGRDDNLFEHYSSVAQRLGVYTAKDYADILEFLVGRWEVEKLTGLSSEGRRAQDYICGLAPRIRKLEERAQARAKQRGPVPFSWIFDKEIKI